MSRVYAVTDVDNTASRLVLEKAGMRHAKDVDLYNSVAEGVILLPFYTIKRGEYVGLFNTAVEFHLGALEKPNGHHHNYQIDIL